MKESTKLLHGFALLALGSGSGTHLLYFPDDAGWGRVFYARSGV
jgi:hypothetical protein